MVAGRNWRNSLVKKVVIYVEGGGDSESLLSECRKGFNKFLTNAGFEGKMPKIVACGSRNNAYDRFCSACKRKGDVLPFLLVDSECVVNNDFQSDENYENWKPWEHLKNRKGDEWEKPLGATENQCHLMVECMEAWLISDVNALKSFYGQGFLDKDLKSVIDVEKISKEILYERLKTATKNTKTKGEYGKGEHSFKLLQIINPNEVIQKSKWAKRFIDVLHNTVS